MTTRCSLGIQTSAHRGLEGDRWGHGTAGRTSANRVQHTYLCCLERVKGVGRAAAGVDVHGGTGGTAVGLGLLGGEQEIWFGEVVLCRRNWGWVLLAKGKKGKVRSGKTSRAGEKRREESERGTGGVSLRRWPT
jgi:hypothetical protein